MVASGPTAVPRWLLCLMGSGEFEPWAEALERDLLTLATGDGSVAIVSTAAAPDGHGTYEAWAAKGVEHYAALGVASHVVDLRDRDDAFRSDVVDSVADASLVFMSGGNAAYLSSVLGGTPVWEAMRRLLERGGAIGGCSAGAMVLGEAAPPCMDAGFQDGDVAPGLALLGNTWIWPHWNAVERDVADRLLSLTEPGGVTVTIDEETAILARGEAWHRYGDGAFEIRPSTNAMPVEVRADEAAPQARLAS
jgi:cyanophycinase